MRKYSSDSRNAALAAWAAWDQDKFWEMHDLLLERSPDLDRRTLDRLARELGLDMDRFTKAMNEETHLRELKENLDRIHDLDIWSTPTTIINGTVIKGAQPYEKYREVVEEALHRSGRARGALTLLSRGLGFFSPAQALAANGEFGRGEVPLYVPIPRARPTNEPVVGEPAPDFTLPGIDDVSVTLSRYRGSKNVLLSFLPAAFTPV